MIIANERFIFKSDLLSDSQKLSLTFRQIQIEKINVYPNQNSLKIQQ
jgi:hypothetical protein